MLVLVYGYCHVVEWRRDPIPNLLFVHRRVSWFLDKERLTVGQIINKILCEYITFKFCLKYAEMYYVSFESGGGGCNNFTRDTNLCKNRER
jgi:hypothetical protein